MSSPTKADLTAAVAGLIREKAELAEEVAALRDLLAAVQALAAAPKPAAYSDRYYWECTDRLSTIAVWAELKDATGEYKVQVIQGWAKAVRVKAAAPVRYEVEAPAPSDDEYRITPKGEAALVAEPAARGDRGERPCANGCGTEVPRSEWAEGNRTCGSVDCDEAATACGSRPYPAGSEGDDGTECTLAAGHDGPHDDMPASVSA